ncbi:hypothetical protein B0H13DRAFT_2342507 [Mycena leptocephala]|nr:hypothetical protein B0H13DRAFT_2342507 [Mycena leptocephala]
MTNKDLADTARTYSDEEFAALIASLDLSESESPGLLIQDPQHPLAEKVIHLLTLENEENVNYITLNPLSGGVSPAAGLPLAPKRKASEGGTFGRGFIALGQSFLVHPLSLTVIGRSEARGLVDGVRNAIYKGYPSVAHAEAAYEYASACSWTCVLTSRPPSPSQAPLAALPSPSEESDRPNPLHGGDSLDNMWYVVYSGITPGVYHSHLEALLNAVEIPNQSYESVQGREEAFRRFRRAQTQQETNTPPAPSYDIASYR